MKAVEGRLILMIGVCESVCVCQGEVPVVWSICLAVLKSQG